VIVTYDKDNSNILRTFAQDYTDELNRELSSRNAPYQFNQVFSRRSTS